MGNKNIGGIKELGGWSSVDLIVRHLKDRTGEIFSINATVRCPLTNCLLISHSNHGGKCGDI